MNEIEEQRIKESLVVFKTSQGVEVRANLARTTRFVVVFEIPGLDSGLRVSEVLGDFQIQMYDRTVYEGRAVLRSHLNTGTAVVCEAALSESGWRDVVFDPATLRNGLLLGQFQEFLGEWQKQFRVRSDFKAVMADFQTFLTDLRLWLERVELGVRAARPSEQQELERVVAASLSPQVIKAIDAFIERFEAIAARLEPDEVPVHQNYLRRQLHPLVLCSPFAHRTYHKPLGYAGDYEMVDMMLRPPHEGGGVFAKIINIWLWGQSPAEAHRNRVSYLCQKLTEEAASHAAHGRRARMLSIGCGPAAEVQRFLIEQPISNRTALTLLDFNEETLRHTQSTLENLCRRHSRTASLEFVKKSVHHMLKDSGRPRLRTGGEQFEYIYCAGLFDYLSDQVCKRLMNLFYELLVPGGLLLASNVSDAMNSSRPFRYSMEYLLDWNLIYRDGVSVGALAPEQAPEENVRVFAEEIGVNVFVEARKPQNE